MPLQIRSKREHCPQCDAVEMHNFLLMRPGEDPAVFVECASCHTFVARYTLKCYTCEDPYRSFLRLMRLREQISASAVSSSANQFTERLWSDYAKAKEIAASQEETCDVEDLIGECAK